MPWERNQQGPLQKGGGCGLARVAQHLDIGEPGRIIDGGMDEVLACAAVTAASVARRTVAGSVEPAQLLDIKVDQLARSLTLVAAHGLRRLGPGQQTQTCAPKPARDGRTRQPQGRGDRRRRHPQGPAQMQDHLDRRFGQPPCHAGGCACAVRKRRLPARTEPGPPLAHGSN